MPTVHAKAVRRAAEICGAEVLATRLGVTQRQLRFWIEGAAVPPDTVFLQVVDILSDHSLEELLKNQPTPKRNDATPA